MKNNSLSKSFTRYAAIQAIYSLNYSKNLPEIQTYLINNNAFLIDLDVKVTFDKTKINKVFLLKILEVIQNNQEKIDGLISSNLTNDWNIDRLPVVQLAILRVAISEMINFPKTSVGIIISEYLMLTESFLQIKSVLLQMLFLKIFIKI
jgi:N utilization substance protein B